MEHGQLGRELESHHGGLMRSRDRWRVRPMCHSRVRSGERVGTGSAGSVRLAGRGERFGSEGWVGLGVGEGA